PFDVRSCPTVVGVDRLLITSPNVTTATRALAAGALLCASLSRAQTPSVIPMDALARAAVVDSLARQLQRFYVRPAVADSLARGLEQRRQAGAFDGARTQAALATQLDRAIRAMVHDDAHLKVRYDPPRSPAASSGAPLDPIAEQRRRRDEFIRDAREES